MTCMPPRALAELTMPLLKPLSCHAIAEASDGGTPFCAAMLPTVDDVTRVPVGTGGAEGDSGTAEDGDVSDVDDSAGEPVGSFSTRPAMRCASGVRPLT